MLMRLKCNTTLLLAAGKKDIILASSAVEFERSYSSVCLLALITLVGEFFFEASVAS